MPDVVQEEGRLDAWRGDWSLCIEPFARSVAPTATAACCLMLDGQATIGPADTGRVTPRPTGSLNYLHGGGPFAIPEKNRARVLRISVMAPTP